MTNSLLEDNHMFIFRDKNGYITCGALPKLNPYHLTPGLCRYACVLVCCVCNCLEFNISTHYFNALSMSNKSTICRIFKSLHANSFDQHNATFWYA